MRYIIIILAVFCFSQETQAQNTTWAGYYMEFTPQDEFLQQFKFPSPSGRQKRYSELRAKEKRMVKSHLRGHYGVQPTNKGYVIGSLQTTGQSLGRLTVYIVTMSAVAIIAREILR